MCVMWDSADRNVGTWECAGGFATMFWGVGNKAGHENDRVGSLGGLAGWVSARISRRGKDRKSKLWQWCVQGHGGTCM